MILYRPVGLRELQWIAEAHFERFPPRLPVQPIFYPVLNYEYAVQIARDWNSMDPASGFAGFVLRFELDPAYAQKLDPKTVGSSRHREFWIPAEELETFNRHIAGKISVVAAFYGPDYQGPVLPISDQPPDESH